MNKPQKSISAVLMLLVICLNLSLSATSYADENLTINPPVPLDLILPEGTINEETIVFNTQEYAIVLKIYTGYQEYVNTYLLYDKMTLLNEQEIGLLKHEVETCNKIKDEYKDERTDLYNYIDAQSKSSSYILEIIGAGALGLAVGIVVGVVL